VSRTEPLVTIATFNTGLEASLAKGALEAVGIRAFIPNEGLGMVSRNRGAIAAEELKVFARDTERARAILRRSELRLVTPDDPPSAPRAPVTPPTREWLATAKVMVALLLAFALLALIANARSRAGQAPFNPPRVGR
jgi:hypothetical protein